MCVRACNALVLKLDYLSTTVCQKLHFLLSDAILRILSRASCACPRTLRVFAHISREDTQDGVSVGGFKMAAMSPVLLYIGQWCLRLREQCLRSEITSVSRVANVLLLRFVAGNVGVNTPASKRSQLIGNTAIVRKRCVIHKKSTCVC